MEGEVQLGEVAEIIMGQSPPGETYNEHGDGLPFFQGVADFNYRHPTPRVFCTAPSRIAIPGDILLSVRAPIGRVNVADRQCAIGRGLAIIRPRVREDGRYLEFALRMLETTWTAIEGGGSVFGNATRRDLETLRVPWPESEWDRRAIAHILGTLDDKIELNRRMSETLEQMARALFKSWFVDFDPVRAKMEGRWQRGQSLPGLPAHLYDLFPDRLVDSELGEIPEGWGVKSIGDLAEVVGGSTPKTECAEFWDGGTHHWVTPKDLSGLSMPVLLDTERKITDAGLAQISSGLLPRGTVLLSSRAPIGYLAIAEVPVAVNQGFIAMKPRQGVSNLFLLRWARAAHDEILSHANGSTFLEISKASFRPIRVVTPPTPIMDAFDQFSRPMYGKVVENALESRTLAALRDALLPKLISGEIRVKDAERFLQERGL
ncbi:MAG: restriction endonuclease subunit S [Chlorobi bacterium]|nr:restriction endonuclease subunit S [Chlorobiota bacterium]